MSALGIRNTMAAKIKKKISVLPNKAEAGKLRMLSIAPVINSVKANVLSLFNVVMQAAKLENNHNGITILLY
jgi:hypothetical protein